MTVVEADANAEALGPSEKYSRQAEKSTAFIPDRDRKPGARSTRTEWAGREQPCSTITSIAARHRPISHQSSSFRVSGRYETRSSVLTLGGTGMAWGLVATTQ